MHKADVIAWLFMRVCVCVLCLTQGEEFKELAVASLRNEEAPGWLGLFPDAALINHSCAPNATGETHTHKVIRTRTQKEHKQTHSVHL